MGFGISLKDVGWLPASCWARPPPQPREMGSPRLEKSPAAKTLFVEQLFLIYIFGEFKKNTKLCLFCDYFIKKYAPCDRVHCGMFISV